ncbi:hypothetical protein H9P43_005827 [Blastocladiella emersonii ATCC 22665]|nr:hypothetical protein H9P43_005827 [Blastocladiella emersonii ATCC 22665]
MTAADPAQPGAGVPPPQPASQMQAPVSQIQPAAPASQVQPDRAGSTSQLHAPPSQLHQQIPPDVYATLTTRMNAGAASAPGAPETKEDKSYGFCLKMVFFLLCMAMFAIPLGLLYGREERINARAENLLRFSPPAATAAGGYISAQIKVTKVDLLQGTSEVMLTNIRPYGKYAASPGSLFLARDTYIFVNGNRAHLRADVPPGDRKLTIEHQSGNVNDYPFDSHSLRIGFYAMTDKSLAETLAATATNSSLKGSPFIPLEWAVSTRQPYAMDAVVDGPGGLPDVGVNNLALKVRRRTSTKLYSALMFSTMWVQSLTLLGMTVLLIIYRSEVNPGLLALNVSFLYILPALRASQPMVPPVGTLADALGYFWNLTLLALSFIVLTIYMWLKNRTEARQRRARRAKAAIEAHLAQIAGAAAGTVRPATAPAAISTSGASTGNLAPQLPPVPALMSPLGAEYSGNTDEYGTIKASSLSASASMAVPGRGSLMSTLAVDPRAVPLPASHIHEDRSVPINPKRPLTGPGAIRTSAVMLDLPEEVAGSMDTGLPIGPSVEVSEDSAGAVPPTPMPQVPATPMPTPVSPPAPGQ